MFSVCTMKHWRSNDVASSFLLCFVLSSLDVVMVWDWILQTNQDSMPLVYLWSWLSSNPYLFCHVKAREVIANNGQGHLSMFKVNFGTAMQPQKSFNILKEDEVACKKIKTYCQRRKHVQLKKLEWY